jgi:hypothetical protein
MSGSPSSLEFLAHPTPTPLQRALVGPAGEHYVLFRLYRLGMLASLAPPASPMVDVLVLTPDQKVIASLQVKTRTYGRDKGWHMRDKHELIVEPRLFYAFVDLEPEPPVTYIVPSSVVADVLRRSHQAWLDTPGRHGQPHRDNPMRRVLPAFVEEVPGYPPGWLEKYREQWSVLTAEVVANI